MSDHDDLLDAMMNAKQAADLAKLRAEQARHIQAHANHVNLLNQQAMNMARNQHDNGWNDPRAMMGAVQKAEGSAISGAMRLPSSEEAYEQLRQVIRVSENLRAKVERTERKVEQLSGFYHWVTEVHPELAAQYKAMRDLYEAANAQPNEAPQREV